MNKSKPNWPLLREAAAIIDGIPDDRFNLEVVYRGDTNRRRLASCGSIGCAIGWLAVHPMFNELGLKIRTHSKADGHSLKLIEWRDKNGQRRASPLASNYAEVASDVFNLNISEAKWLFGTTLFPFGRNEHKRIFRARMVNLLRRHGQKVNPAYTALAHPDVLDT